MDETIVSKEYLRSKIKELIDRISENGIELTDDFINEYNEKYVPLVKDWVFTTVPYDPHTNELFVDVNINNKFYSEWNRYVNYAYIQKPDPFIGFSIQLRKDDPLYDYDLSYDSLMHAFNTNNRSIINSLEKHHIHLVKGTIVLEDYCWDKIPMFQYNVFTVFNTLMIKFLKTPVILHNDGITVKALFSELNQSEKINMFKPNQINNKYLLVSQKKCPLDESSTSYRIVGFNAYDKVQYFNDPIFPWVNKDGARVFGWEYYEEIDPGLLLTYPIHVFFKYPPTIKNSIKSVINEIRDPENLFSRSKCFETLNDIIDQSIPEDMNMDSVFKNLIDLLGGIRRAKINRNVSMSNNKNRIYGPYNIDFSLYNVAASGIDFNNTAIFNLHRKYKEELKHRLQNFSHDRELMKKEDIDNKFQEIYNIWNSLPRIELNTNVNCTFQTCSHSW